MLFRVKRNGWWSRGDKMGECKWKKWKRVDKCLSICL